MLNTHDYVAGQHIEANDTRSGGLGQDLEDQLHIIRDSGAESRPMVLVLNET